MVIPALNESENIGNCLKGLQGQTRPPDEIIVVDNGSEDNTVEIARGFGPIVSILSYPRPKVWYGNVGLVRQTGVEAAQGEVIVSTDADYTHPKNYLEKIDRYFQSSKLAVLGGPIYLSNPDPLMSFIIQFGNFHRSYWHDWGFSMFWGGNTSFRRDTFMLTEGYKGAAAHGPVEEWIVSLRLARVGDAVWSNDVYSYTRIAEHWRNYYYTMPLTVAPLAGWYGLSAFSGGI